MNEPTRYYWDSSVFCSFLNKEENRWSVVRDLLKEAHAGRIEIVTSSFAVVEVLKLKGHSTIDEKKEKDITMFFEYPFITLFDADRNICEQARRFVWKNGMKPKDAVHLATCEIAAQRVKIHELFSWDDDFVRLNGKGVVSFPLSQPYMNQALLQLTEDENPKDEEDDKA